MRLTSQAAAPRALLPALALGAALLGPRPAPAQSWSGYGRDPSHTATTPVASQPPERVIWHTPVDLNPQLSGDDLLIHYGSPLVTRNNTVIVTVKTGAFNGFKVEARRGADGSLVWSAQTDYTLPPHGWVPSCNPTLTPKDAKLVIPAEGGTVLTRTSPDKAGVSLQRAAFYGLSNYNQNPGGFRSTVRISTPITSDRLGNLYFGYVVTGTAPLGSLQSGLARISSAGQGTWVTAATMAGDFNIKKVAYNCAPALNLAGDTVYVAVNDRAPGDNSFGSGYLVALDSATLAPKSRVLLKDPRSGNNASISDDGTASPTVGPDGDVYYGVIENGFYSNHARGWLLHFNAGLSQTKTPSSFGWDNTPSIVTSDLVPSYAGTSPYLLLTKYNNYVQGGGDGVNRLAVVDPGATMPDPINPGSGLQVMKAVLTVAGVTPDDSFPNVPGAVREWCINTAAIDAVNKCAVVNSEDGHVYRWDFTTNLLSAGLLLNGPIGEAYTPTVVGPDGAIYAINNATLYCCGRGLGGRALLRSSGR